MAEMEGFVCPECDGVEFESAESLMAHFEQAHNVTSPQPERGKKKKKRRKPKVFGGSDGGGDGAGGDADELQQAKKPIDGKV
eukprot:gene20965-26645_t